MVPAASLIALTIIGAGPWLAYASHMWYLNRESLPDADITKDIDHYSVQGGLAVGLLILTFAVALLPSVRVYAGITAATCAFYLGLVSLAAHPDEGSLDKAWSLATMVWAVLVAAAVAVTMPRRATGVPVRARGEAPDR